MSAKVEVTPLPGSKAFIPGLDGIRALAVMTIFVFHAQILRGVPGELATTTFFFLSGFLITTLFVKEWRKTGDLDLKGFYYRRALRTLPPLYLALGVSFLVSAVLKLGGPVETWKAMSGAFNFTNYALISGGSTAGFLPGMVLLWSLAVDEHYYLLFAPLIKIGLKRLSMRGIIGSILFLCAAALAWRIWLVNAEQAVTFRETMSTDTRIDSILFGSLLALWRNPALDPEKAKLLIKPVWVIAGLLGLGYVLVSRNWFITGTIGFTIQGLAFMPLFSLAILKGGQGALGFLKWPWLLWVSRASYSLYLLQWIMITVCENYVPGSRPVQMLAAAVLTLITGAAMHYGVEKPLAALRKRSKKAAVVAEETQVAVSPVDPMHNRLRTAPRRL